MAETRDLTAGERALLEVILGNEPFSGAKILVAQIDSATVAGGLPTLLDLTVPHSLAAAPVPDGPVPVRAFVEAPNGDVEGELIVWVRAGYLSGLEFAWYTDEAPSDMPTSERLRIETV